MPPLPEDPIMPDLPVGADSFDRINIVGSSGSGKSTAGKLIAKKLGYPYVELDEIQWKPNWTESTEQDFFQPGTLARGRILGAGWELFENRLDQMAAGSMGGLVGFPLLVYPVPGH